MYEIPISIVLAFLLMLIVSLFFNTYTFYKWHKLIEEYEDFRGFVKTNTGWYFRDFIKTNTGWDVLD